MTGDPFDLTDLGNAKRLHCQHGSVIRFVPAENAFYVYDGGCWHRDETGEVERRAKDTVLQIGEAARRMHPNSAEGIERQKLMGKWAIHSQAAQRIRAMIDLVKSEPGISVPHEIFDREPGRLNFQNGIVDLQNSILCPHRPEHNVTKCIDVDYDPDATAPTWEAFLERIMPSVEMREISSTRNGLHGVWERVGTNHLLRRRSRREWQKLVSRRAATCPWPLRRNDGGSYIRDTGQRRGA